MSARPGVLTTAAAGLAGLAVSAYLTLGHSAPAAAACGAHGIVDCERVLSSGFSAIPGTAVPTAAAGLVWFPVGAGLALARMVMDSEEVCDRP
jgi:uncharacterized membrane protein